MKIFITDEIFHGNWSWGIQPPSSLFATNGPITTYTTRTLEQAIEEVMKFIAIKSKELEKGELK